MNKLGSAAAEDQQFWAMRKHRRADKGGGAFFGPLRGRGESFISGAKRSGATPSVAAAERENFEISALANVVKMLSQDPHFFHFGGPIFHSRPVFEAISRAFLARKN